MRNLSDGRVEVVADGERPALEALVVTIGGGPPGGFVRDLHQDWQHVPGQEKEFEIR